MISPKYYLLHSSSSFVENRVAPCQRLECIVSPLLTAALRSSERSLLQKKNLLHSTGQLNAKHIIMSRVLVLARFPIHNSISKYARSRMRYLIRYSLQNGRLANPLLRWRKLGMYVRLFSVSGLFRLEKSTRIQATHDSRRELSLYLKTTKTRLVDRGCRLQLVASPNRQRRKQQPVCRQWSQATMPGLVLSQPSLHFSCPKSAKRRLRFRCQRRHIDHQG
jgi:hypothetical protein